MPPEILGLSVLSPKDIGVLAGCYANFETDLKDALKYVNKANCGILPIPVRRDVEKVIGILILKLTNNIRQ